MATPDHRGAPPKRSSRAWVFQFLRFITVGLMNTAVELLVYNALLAIHNPHNLQILTVYSTLGVVAAIANSYLWNSRWAFRDARAQNSRHAMRQRVLFVAQALVNIGINDAVTVAITPALTDWDVLPRVVAQNLAKVVAMGTSSISSFMMLSWLVFNAGDGAERQPSDESDDHPTRRHRLRGHHARRHAVGNR